jgi:ParB family transcriptional regulator, chromosome partitioning protein
MEEDPQTVHRIVLARIFVSDNVRKDLGDLSEMASSIKANGVQHPISVRPKPGTPGNYLLVYGQCRLAASKLAGKLTIPAIIVQRAGADEAWVAQIVENFHRKAMTPAETVRALVRLAAPPPRGRGWSQSLIAARTGMAPSSVSRYLALQYLGEDGLRKLESGELTVGEGLEAVRSFRQRYAAAPGKGGYRKRTPEEIAEHLARSEEYRKARLHFSAAHPLADKAKLRCDLAGHQDSVRLGGKNVAGKIACLPCWEGVIREDERAKVLAEMRRPPALAIVQSC